MKYILSLIAAFLLGHCLGIWVNLTNSGITTQDIMACAKAGSGEIFRCKIVVIPKEVK